MTTLSVRDQVQVQATVVRDVIIEREQQDKKWGIQDRPIYPPRGFTWISQGEYLSLAERFKKTNDYRFENGQLGWDTILLEEVYEALAERDPEKQEQELIQTAAVCFAIVENLRRRKAEKALQEVA